MFSGSSTYELALFIQGLVAEGGDNALITVTGVDTQLLPMETESEFVGIPLAGVVDGYCRTVEIRTAEGGRVDVGGSNATLERVRSRQTRCVMSEDMFEAIASKLPWLWAHKEEISQERLHRYLDDSVDHERIDVVASLAQRLQDEASARFLLDLLQDRHVPSYTLMLTQSFRSFEDLCRENEDCAMTLTLGLGDYIRDGARWGDHSHALVYAIESLASVAKHHRYTRQVAGHGLVQFLRRDSNLMSHPDVAWAALVALEQIRPADPATISALNGIVRSLAPSTRGHTHIISSHDRLLRACAKES